MREVKGGAVLLVALALLLPGALAAGARVHSSAYRMDLGPLAPGDVREGSFVLTNEEDRAVDVHLVPDAVEPWVFAPSPLRLEAGEAREVRYVYAVPQTAAPGEHGEPLRIVIGERPEGSATLSSSTAIIFTSRTRAIGVSSIEAPTLALPGAPIDGAVQVVNTWTNDVNATVEVAWRDLSGATRGNVSLGPALARAGSGTRLAFSLPADAAAGAGAQTLEARIVSTDAAGAPLAGPTLHAFQLGKRSATHALVGVTDLGDGNATAVILLVNTGDLPITITPRVVVRDAAGVERVFLLDPVTLAPGERREVTAVMLLPEGRFSVRSEAEGAEADVTPAALGAEAAHAFEMTAPREGLDVLRLASYAAIAAVALALGLVAWRGRAAMGRAGATLLAWAARATPRLRRRDPFDELFARIGDDKPAHAPVRAVPVHAAKAHGRPAAFLLDLEGFGGDASEVARLALFVAGHDVQAAYAYARAPSAEAAARLEQELAAAGYHARIATGGADLHVQLSVDAMREMHAGRTILLATHDAAYGPLARAIQEDGGRLVGFPIARRVPVEGDPRAGRGPRAQIEERG